MPVAPPLLHRVATGGVEKIMRRHAELLEQPIFEHSPPVVGVDRRLETVVQTSLQRRPRGQSKLGGLLALPCEQQSSGRGSDIALSPLPKADSFRAFYKAGQPLIDAVPRLARGDRKRGDPAHRLRLVGR